MMVSVGQYVTIKDGQEMWMAKICRIYIKRQQQQQQQEEVKHGTSSDYWGQFQLLYLHKQTAFSTLECHDPHQLFVSNVVLDLPLSHIIKLVSIDDVSPESSEKQFLLSALPVGCIEFIGPPVEVQSKDGDIKMAFLEEELVNDDEFWLDSNVVYHPQDESLSSSSSSIVIDQLVNKTMSRKRKRTPTKGDDDDIYKTLFGLLHTSHNPAKLPARQDKHDVIHNFVMNWIANYQEETKAEEEEEEVVKSKIVANRLFISGCVGTGKTRMVEQVIREIIDQPSQSIKPRILQVNAKTMSPPHMIYSKLYRFLYDDAEFKGSPKKCRKLLLAYYSPELSTSSLDPEVPLCLTPILLIIDEIDCLRNPKEQIYYDLFTWAFEHPDKLCIIGISNTVNFSHTVSPRVKSRMGNNDLFFQQYQIHEWLAIYLDRLHPFLYLIDSDALLLACQKAFLKSSGDARHALRLMATAFDLLQIQQHQRLSSSPTLNLTKDHIHDAESQMSMEPNYPKIFRGLAIYGKLFLLALIQYSNRENQLSSLSSSSSSLLSSPTFKAHPTVDYYNVYKQDFLTLCRRKGIPVCGDETTLYNCIVEPTLLKFYHLVSSRGGSPIYMIKIRLLIPIDLSLYQILDNDNDVKESQSLESPQYQIQGVKLSSALAVVTTAAAASYTGESLEKRNQHYANILKTKKRHDITSQEKIMLMHGLHQNFDDMIFIGDDMVQRQPSKYLTGSGQPEPSISPSLVHYLNGKQQAQQQHPPKEQDEQQQKSQKKDRKDKILFSNKRYRDLSEEDKAIFNEPDDDLPDVCRDSAPSSLVSISSSSPCSNKLSDPSYHSCPESPLLLSSLYSANGTMSCSSSSSFQPFGGRLLPPLHLSDHSSFPSSSSSLHGLTSCSSSNHCYGPLPPEFAFSAEHPAILPPDESLFGPAFYSNNARAAEKIRRRKEERQEEEEKHIKDLSEEANDIEVQIKEYRDKRYQELLTELKRPTKAVKITKEMKAAIQMLDWQDKSRFYKLYIDGVYAWDWENGKETFNVTIQPHLNSFWNDVSIATKVSIPVNVLVKDGFTNSRLVIYILQFLLRDLTIILSTKDPIISDLLLKYNPALRLLRGIALRKDKKVFPPIDNFNEFLKSIGPAKNLHDLKNIITCCSTLLKDFPILTFDKEQSFSNILNGRESIPKLNKKADIDIMLKEWCMNFQPISVVSDEMLELELDM